MFKPYLALIKIVLIVSALGIASYFIRESGKDSVRAEIARTEQKEKIKDAEKVKEVIKYKEKIKVVYRDKIIKVKQAKDTTGCADTKLTDMGFRL